MRRVRPHHKPDLQCPFGDQADRIREPLTIRRRLFRPWVGAFDAVPTGVLPKQRVPGGFERAQ